VGVFKDSREITHRLVVMYTKGQFESFHTTKAPGSNDQSLR